MSKFQLLRCHLHSRVGSQEPLIPLYSVELMGYKNVYDNNTTSGYCDEDERGSEIYIIHIFQLQMKELRNEGTSQLY